MLVFQLEPDAAGNINYVGYVNMWAGDHFTCNL